MKKPILFIFTIICLPILADAHHSTAANFTQEIISIKGVIESVRSVNPHSSILIKNTDESLIEIKEYSEFKGNELIRLNQNQFDVNVGIYAFNVPWIKNNISKF